MNCGKSSFKQRKHAPGVQQIPQEERERFVRRLFEVNPLAIDKTQFERARLEEICGFFTPRMESIRQEILGALIEVDEHPEKYASKFYTFVPDKTWYGSKRVAYLKKYATRLGGEMGDWIHLTLEWAQKISNGESLDRICYDSDKHDWYRMVVFDTDDTRRIGGSFKVGNNASETYVEPNSYFDFSQVDNAVPYVVFKNIDPQFHK